MTSPAVPSSASSPAPVRTPVRPASTSVETPASTSTAPSSMKSHVQPSIIFFGNGPLADAALATLKKHFTIAFHARTREDLSTVVELKTAHPELPGILASYGVFVPTKVLALFESTGGILNIHPSLLPAYRGPSPIESAILDGCLDFSVSIMKLVKEMDAGPIYYQTTLPNLPYSKATIYEQLATAGAAWLVKNLFNLPTPVAQQGTPTYTHKFEKKDGFIDPSIETATQIYRKIIAFQGFPKVKFALQGTNCIILDAYPLEQGTTAPLTITGSDGAKIAITRLQPENRKPMDAKSFLNGYAKHATM